jgi:hypothetical protein
MTVRTYPGMFDTPDDQVIALIARHAVAVCIGSRARLPDLPGIAEARPWTNREGTDSSSVPNRLAVHQRGLASPPRGLPRLLIGHVLLGRPQLVDRAERTARAVRTATSSQYREPVVEAFLCDPVPVVTV